MSRATHQLKAQCKPWLEACVDVLFPPTCGACQAPMPSLVPLCSDCTAEAELTDPPLCLRCGLPLHIQRCPDCGAMDAAGFDLARARYLYSGPVERALRRAKLGGVPHVAIAVGRELGRAIVAGELKPLNPRPDLVVAVPVGVQRLRERGYDQAALMARAVSEILNIPNTLTAIHRARETASQATLERRDRRSNVRDAFAPSQRLQGLRVLLVDDVMTTGCTADAAARALRAGGAVRVEVACFARATM